MSLVKCDDLKAISFHGANYTFENGIKYERPDKKTTTKVVMLLNRIVRLYPEVNIDSTRRPHYGQR